MSRRARDRRRRERTFLASIGDERAVLLPELWNEILEKVRTQRDAITRARCRRVCQAWRDQDPNFIVPMSPGLGALIRLSAFKDDPPHVRAYFSRVFYDLWFYDTWTLHTIWIAKDYVVQFSWIHTVCGKCLPSQVSWSELSRDIFPMIKPHHCHMVRYFSDPYHKYLDNVCDPKTGPFFSYDPINVTFFSIKRV